MKTAPKVWRMAVRGMIKIIYSGFWTACLRLFLLTMSILLLKKNPHLHIQHHRLPNGSSQHPKEFHAHFIHFISKPIAQYLSTWLLTKSEQKIEIKPSNLVTRLHITAYQITLSNPDSIKVLPSFKKKRSLYECFVKAPFTSRKDTTEKFHDIFQHEHINSMIYQ